MNSPEAHDRPETGRPLFLRDPEAFDREIRYFVPYQPEILDSLFEAILLMETDYAPILELGCRTGMLSSRLLEEKPYVKLTAVDQEPSMLLACKERLGRAADWVEVERRTIARYSRQEAYDYVLSNLALHFLESAEDQESVCRNAFWSLKPGGIFAFAVMLDVDGTEAGEKLWKQWERDVMAVGARRQDIQDWHLNNRPAYRPVSQETWLERLREAGFVHSEIVWNQAIFGTFWAKKPFDRPAGRPSSLS